MLYGGGIFNKTQINKIENLEYDGAIISSALHQEKNKLYKKIFMMNKQIIGVVDYKVGNLKSIFRTLNNAKVNYKMVNNFKDLRGCDKFILPGEGNFGYCINFLKQTKLDLEILNAASKDKIILGICMGMQILFKNSE